MKLSGTWMVSRSGMGMNIADVQSVHRILDELQSGSSGKFILYEPAPTGLGGQISGRIGGLLAGIATNRGVIFLRTDDPPYAQSFEAMGVPTSIIPAHEINGVLAPDIAIGSLQADDIVRLSPFRTSLRSHDVEAALLANFQKVTGLVDVSRLEAEGAIRTWMRLTDHVKAEIGAKLNDLGIDRKTLGVHVRRGDKQVESAFLPLPVIQERVESLVRAGGFNSIFIASDSEEVINTFRPPPGIALIVDRAEKRYNNANHKMLFSRQEMRDEETLTAISNIDALSRCGGLVGQDNAHFAVIASGVIMATCPDHHVYLFPGNYVEQKSILVRLFFSTKRTCRAVIRMVAPWATIRSRSRKALR